MQIKKLTQSYFIVPTMASTLLVLLLFVNCSPNNSPKPTPTNNNDQLTTNNPWNPPVGVAVEGATLLDGWTDLRIVDGGLNVDGGWTDSVGISWDGKSILFGYSRFDFGIFNDSAGLTWTVTGPSRTGMTGDYFKMFKADLIQNNWSISYIPFNGNPAEHEFAAQTNLAGDVSVFTRWVGGKGDLFYSLKNGSIWSAPLSIAVITGGSNINSSCSDDNGFVVGTLSDGLRIYFESDRTDAAANTCGGPVHIYYSDYNPTTNSFSAVQLVNGINGAAPIDKDFQPFFTPDKSKAFWTALRASDYAVYTADLSAGQYINVRPVVRPTFVAPFTGKLVLVGEANIAEVPEGWLMYLMCGIAQSESGGKPSQVQLKICVAKKNR